MRLLFFTPLLSTRGGLERTLIDKANYMVERKHEVMIVTYEHVGPVAYELSQKVRHVDLDCHYFAIYRFPLYMRLWMALKLKRLFRQRMKCVIDEFRPDTIAITIPNTENYLCDIISVSGLIPVIIESHLAQGYEVIKRGVTEKMMLFFFNSLKAIKKANLLVSLTEGDAACWHRKGVENIKVLPNPLTHYEELLSPMKKIEGRIICVGRLTKQKRFDRLIKAFSLIADKYPTWYIDIYGEGEEYDSLMAQVSIMSLSNRVHILSPTNNIYDEYQRSQFLVLSSDFEGFGLVIIEAMACGIPVVATDCPFGPSDIIRDNETGLLCKMDVDSLAEKMEWLISHDAERQSMGYLAHEVASLYRKELIISKWEQTYRSCE